MDRRELHETRQEGARQERALLLESLVRALGDPHGYAVILHLLAESRLFEPCAPPPDTRALFDAFFRDLEEAAPEKAVRLFAQCRGIPFIRT